MMRRSALVFLTLFAASTLLAQALPPGKWWRRPDIVQMLNLSSEQQDKLEAIFRNAAPDLIDLKADIDKTSIALRGELDRPQLDRGAIHKIAAHLSDVRGKLFDRELTMLIEMRGVLSDPQWDRMRNELDKLQEQRPMRPMQQRPRP